mgnify:CR=1 FL=1
MADQNRKLNAVEQAAIVLMSIGEQSAAEVMKQLEPREVCRLGEAMVSMEGVTAEQVEQTIGAFVQEIGSQTSVGAGSEEYLGNVLTSALGEHRAGDLLERILPGRDLKGFEALKWAQPRVVGEFLGSEHPQVAAAALSFLDTHHAARVAAALPEGLRSEVLMRMATLDGIRPSALQELDAILQRQFGARADNLRVPRTSGEDSAAAILNSMDPALESAVLDGIRESDPELGRNIEQRMFGFDRLADMDDRSIQALLREVSSDALISALKGADERVKDRIFSNMSRRAGEVLREDLEARGPVPMSEVEAAQRDVLAIARRMQDTGDLLFGGTDALV